MEKNLLPVSYTHLDFYDGRNDEGILVCTRASEADAVDLEYKLYGKKYAGIL